MRTAMVTFSTVFFAVTLATAAGTPLNPQPLPPGYHANGAATTQFEPPDPCLQAHSAMMTNGQFTERTRPGQHKLTALHCVRYRVRPGVHMLNPQPLPPG